MNNSGNGKAENKIEEEGNQKKLNRRKIKVMKKKSAEK